MKLTAVDLNRLFEEEPPTVRRPDLAEAIAKRMNHVREVRLVSGEQLKKIEHPLTTEQESL